MAIIEPGGGRVFKRMNDMTVKVKSSDTNGTYEMCEEKCPPGFESRRHLHAKDFETFYMVSGSATWEVGDETVERLQRVRGAPACCRPSRGAWWRGPSDTLH